MAYSADPTLWLYTSLTAGSSHIITATSRLETILKAHKIPFRALDVATDEKARMLWGRRSKGRKLPGLVKYGTVVGDLEEIEEWNEYGELKQQLSAADADAGITPSASTSTATAVPAPAPAPSNPDPPPAVGSDSPQTRSRSASDTRHISISEPIDSHDNPSAASKRDETPLALAMRQAGAEAAAKAGQKKAAKAIPVPAPTPATAGKEPEVVSTTATPVTDESTTDKEAAVAGTEPPVLSESTADKSVEDSTVPESHVNKSIEDPEIAPEMTAAKMPTQLASEGAKRTSIDKIASSEASTDPSSLLAESASPTTSDPAPSNEEQLLQLRHDSTTPKKKSRLASEVEPEDVTEAESESTSAVAADSTDIADEAVPPMRTHRGSSISAASKEEILAAEKRNVIPEEDEGEEEVEAEKETATKHTSDQDPKNAEDAGFSVGD